MENFEPTIVAFCCHFCAYTAADLAGTMRLQYPSNVRIIRIPCTGKVDVRHLLEAFEKGADGVYVAGCLEGDCHYLKGNFRAKKRVALAKQILEDAGIGGRPSGDVQHVCSHGPAVCGSGPGDDREDSQVRAESDQEKRRAQERRAQSGKRSKAQSA